VKSIGKLNYIIFLLIGILISCTNNRPQVIVITSTVIPIIPESTLVPTVKSAELTAETISVISPPDQYVVQAGDTLSGIAVSYNISLQSLLFINDIQNPDLLEIGQVLLLPEIPSTFTPNIQMLSDMGLIRSPHAKSFNLHTFLSSNTGYVNTVNDTVKTRLADGSELSEVLTAEAIIERVSLEYSIDTRVLLTFLEYHSRWLSQSDIAEELQDHPIVSIEESNGVDRSGLYKQLSWLANELNRGYYDWKYRRRSILEFQDGYRLLYEPTLNAGTISLQYVLSLNNTVDQWLFDVSQDGFIAIYRQYFEGDFGDNIEVIQYPLNQPILTLPFPPGDVWRFTGGFHGGWGGGSAWAALDFAPPDKREDGDPFCYISQYPVTAVASGVIARTSGGALVLDIDGDGNESSGWTILYLHLTVEPSIVSGQSVQIGDELGSASCQGGFSTATHLHIARRYNGEWIPADCIPCSSFNQVSPFLMSNWKAVGLENQQYQGYMVNISNSQQVVAEQGRKTKINEISW
jgi:LasA protease